MYRYNDFDQRFLDERVEQYRSQTNRYLAGELTADQFQQLRLRNGLYIQRLAPMLRVAVPYGIISAEQLRTVARISRDYDKGYGHLSTRQNIQLNWPELEEVPDILAELAKVEMHAIQTSGSCIRNITTDQFAGVAADEIVDARPYCELMRQWATFHPEFSGCPVSSRSRSAVRAQIGRRSTFMTSASRSTARTTVRASTSWSVVGSVERRSSAV